MSYERLTGKVRTVITRNSIIQANNSYHRQFSLPVVRRVSVRKWRSRWRVEVRNNYPVFTCFGFDHRSGFHVTIFARRQEQLEIARDKVSAARKSQSQDIIVQSLDLTDPEKEEVREHSEVISQLSTDPIYIRISTKAARYSLLPSWRYY